MRENWWDLKQKYNKTYIMCYVSTDKQIPMRGEEIMNYRNCTTVQIS